MGPADTTPDHPGPDETWIDQYKIQSRDYSRLVTVPKEVDLDVAETVWVWSQPDDDEQHIEYLRLSTDRPAHAPPFPGERFCGTRSIMPQGDRGKSVTIPHMCDDERFACDSMVGISCCWDDHERVRYLRLIPESVYSSTLARVCHQ